MRKQSKWSVSRLSSEAKKIKVSPHLNDMTFKALKESALVKIKMEKAYKMLAAAGVPKSPTT